jgi:ribosomal protein S18 acetylase RimI-like enzyme
MIIRASGSVGSTRSQRSAPASTCPPRSPSCGRRIGAARSPKPYLATYGYLTDVVIAPEHQRRGLGTWLTECMIRHPQLQGFRRLALVTRDAEALYARAGFSVGAGPLVYMERRNTGIGGSDPAA